MSKVDEVVAECLFRIGKRRAVLRRAGDGAAESSSAENYDEWRQNRLETRFTEFFDPRLVEGRDVLDFACGAGSLALYMARLGASKVCGMDLNATAIASAVKAAEARGIAAEFRVPARSDRIELADNSWDVIVCWSVLEHILDYESIIPEWKRILRPDGKVLIRWTPHFHPYGHHADTYVPIPWMHAFVSERIINMACSKMVNAPEFKPPYWDLDEHGNRRDRFAGSSTFGHLNHLTIAKFEKICRDSGFRFARREFHTFASLKRLPVVEDVLTLPRLREFFTSSVVYELAVA